MTHARFCGSHCAHQPSSSFRVIFASATALAVPRPEVRVIDGLGHLLHWESQPGWAIAGAAINAIAAATAQRQSAGLAGSIRA